MGWKDWPYWLKGGLIGAVIGIICILLAWFRVLPILTVLLYIFIMILCGSGESYSITGGLLGNCSWGGKYLIFSIMTILILLVFFVVGSIIGLIVQKIKSK